VNPTVKGNLIGLGKRAAALLICIVQVLFFFQVVPYGGLYIGLLSLVLDVSIYCWVVSGACKAMTARPGRGEPARKGGDAHNLLLN
jgi:hypothetical protein